MATILVSQPRPTSDNIRKIMKRSDWAQNQPGVILVFVIVFIIGCGILMVMIHKEWLARKAERAKWSVEEITDDDK